MKFLNELLLVIIVLTITTFSGISKTDSTYIDINLSGAISGSYLIKNLNFARIQNPVLPIESTIGVFSDPPSKEFPFDISMILGNLGSQKIEIGDYKFVEVVNDVPNLQVGQKGGFMTIVPTGQNPPKTEYFTSSGSFIVAQIIESTKINGTFDLQLKSFDGKKIINATGKFQIFLAE